MTTELNRLLEIHEQRGFYHQFDLCQDEEKSLKLKIESKLAQADNEDTDLIRGLKGDIELASYQIHKLQSNRKELEKELSKLRPIVQALRERIGQLGEDSSWGKTCTCKECVLREELESILASSDKNLSSEVKQ